MIISELIGILEEIKAKEGDLPVWEYTHAGVREKTKDYIAAKYVKILKGRESRQSYWYDWEDEDRKGEKVLAI